MNPLNKYSVYGHLRSESGPVAPKRKAIEGAAAELLAHKRPEMTWKDHLVMLLHIGAEIEHSLMVQYLYAAYSLGGEQVPAHHARGARDRTHGPRDMVKRWQDDILAVAKEEMGHLMTVQNILTFIGAPINLGRMDLPWDIPFYPFPFQLEPLTLESLACYVYAEMPAPEEFDDAVARSPSGKLLKRYQHFVDHDREKITAIAKKVASKHGAHRVGGLYDEIVELLGDRRRIPDHVFHEKTYAFQASVDDWGRGYQPRPRLLDAEGSFAEELPKATRDAHVMIDRVATRGDAIEAIKALSLQGEAPSLATKEEDEFSHFDRFLIIYQQFDAVGGKWRPARSVPKNPTTVRDPASDDGKGYISAAQSRNWASLFNLRYRMLLRYLGHTFRLARAIPGDSPNVRAMVMHRVFGEMYNVKTIAGILVRLPQNDPEDEARAGPPFEMPYTLDLPGGELECWIQHRDLIRSAQRLCKRLLAHADTVERDYLSAQFGLDGQTAEWMGRIIDGLAVKREVMP